MKKPKTEKLRLIPYPVILYLKMREKIHRFGDELFDTIYHFFVFDEDDWY